MLNTQQLNSIIYFLNKSQLIGNESTNHAIILQAVEQEIKSQQQTQQQVLKEAKVVANKPNKKEENGK